MCFQTSVFVVLYFDINLRQTTSAVDGTYTLSGLPLNTGSDEYFVVVDIPGLDTNGSYHRVINLGNTQFTNLDFTVDSVYINPIGSITSTFFENSVLDNKVTMFPNPTNHHISIQYELINSANVEIDLYDLMGKKIINISSLTHEEKNKYNHCVNIENLSTGIYFVKIKINDSENNMKLIVTE